MRLNEDKDFDHLDATGAFGFDPISFKEGISKEVTLYKQIRDQYIYKDENKD